MGVIRRLPNPRGRVFDSRRVDASDCAYKRLQTPDGLLMTGTCAMTAILAGAGRQRNRALFAYCPAASLVSAVPVLPEAMRAVRTLLGRR